MHDNFPPISHVIRTHNVIMLDVPDHGLAIVSIHLLADHPPGDPHHRVGVLVRLQIVAILVDIDWQHVTIHAALIHITSQPPLVMLLTLAGALDHDSWTHVSGAIGAPAHSLVSC